MIKNELIMFKAHPKTIGYTSFLLIAALFLVVGRYSQGYSIVLSVSIFLFIFALFLLFSSRFVFSLLLSSTLILVMGAINRVKFLVYKDMLLFSDFYLMVDPENISILSEYIWVGIIFVALIGLVVVNAIIGWKNSVRTCSYISKGGALLIMLFSYIAISYSVPIVKTTWTPQLYRNQDNVITNLWMSFHKHYQPPQFNESTEYFTVAQKKLDINSLFSQTKKPDIVVLLQESTVNPSLYALPRKHSVPNLEMFEDDKNVIASGLMRVHTYGGGTWLSEFAFLTGLASDDFGIQKSGVFYQVVPHLHHSLLKELKRNGYHTILLNPFNKHAYASSYAYKHMGIDEIIQPQDLGYPGEKRKNLWDIPSQQIINYVKRLLETKTNKPLFIFALTMNEHGAYDANYPDKYHLSSFIKSSESAGRFGHFMHKLLALDLATQNFSQYVMNRKKPTMFLYFGDHQPDIFWEKGYSSQLANPAWITQFVLKDNVDKGKKIKNVGEITDISFLGGMLLERANLDVSPFYKANIAMRHLCKGGLSDCADQKLVNSYKSYIYHTLNAASASIN